MKSKSKPIGKPKQVSGGATPQKFVDRDLVAVNPLKEQFEPTESSPVPQRYKMAGGA
jgi:hypothetical protein